MKRSCTLIVMSLVLLLGLWGYSMSMDSPYPRQPQDLTTNSGPADQDHPWGGDEGHSGGGSPTAIGPTDLHIVTGNAVVDVVLNQTLFRGRILTLLFSTKTKTTNTGSTVKTTTPTSSSNNSAN
jgi:hypothetical protein